MKGTIAQGHGDVPEGTEAVDPEVWHPSASTGPGVERPRRHEGEERALEGLPKREAPVLGGLRWRILPGVERTDASAHSVSQNEPASRPAGAVSGTVSSPASRVGKGCWWKAPGLECGAQAPTR